MLGIFLDSETNGLNPHLHVLLELAYKIVDVQTGQCLLAHETCVKQPREAWERSDPDSLKINGFTWDMVCSGEEPHQAAEQVIAHFSQFSVSRKNAVFICQNPSFDRAFFSQLIEPDIQESLGWPYHWLDLASMFWAKNKSPWENGISKDKIAGFYRLAPEANPHRAMNGVDHLLLCYRAVVGFQSLTTNDF